jgi:molecular chaperone Hsp33
VIVTLELRELLQSLMEQLGAFPSPMLHLGHACLGALLVQATADPLEDEQVELQWMLDGPFGALHARSEGFAKVRGSIGVPQVLLPQLETSLGNGIFQCRKTKNHVHSQGLVPSSGWVYQDLQEFFEVSEQKKCAVGLSLHFALDESRKEQPFVIDRALAYLVHMLPSEHGVEAARLEAMDRHLKNLGPISEWVLNPKDSADTTLTMARFLSAEMQVQTLHESKVELFCSCTKEKVLRAISLLTARERSSWLGKEEGDAADYEIKCEFCGKLYKIAKSEVLNLFS